MRRLLFLFLICAALLSATQTTIGFTAWSASHAQGNAYVGMPGACAYVDSTATPGNLGYTQNSGATYDCYMITLSYNLASLAGATVSAIDIVWPTNAPPGVYDSSGTCSLVGEWYAGNNAPDQIWSSTLIPATAFSVPFSNGYYQTTSPASNIGSVALGSTQWVRYQVQCNSNVNYAVYDGSQRNIVFSWNGDQNNLPKLRFTYTTNVAPTTTSLSGLAANINLGVYQTISAAVADADGASTLDNWLVLLSYGVDGTNACYMLLENRNNRMYLNNDAANSWGTPQTMGAAAFLENSACKIDLSGCSFGGTGANSTATLKLYLKPGFFTSPQTGTVRSYLYATDLNSTYSGWSAAYTTTALRTGPMLVISSRH